MAASDSLRARLPKVTRRWLSWLEHRWNQILIRWHEQLQDRTETVYGPLTYAVIGIAFLVYAVVAVGKMANPPEPNLDTWRSVVSGGAVLPSTGVARAAMAESLDEWAHWALGFSGAGAVFEAGLFSVLMSSGVTVKASAFMFVQPGRVLLRTKLRSWLGGMLGLAFFGAVLLGPGAAALLGIGGKIGVARWFYAVLLLYFGLATLVEVSRVSSRPALTDYLAREDARIEPSTFFFLSRPQFAGFWVNPRSLTNPHAAEMYEFLARVSKRRVQVWGEVLTLVAGAALGVFLGLGHSLSLVFSSIGLLAGVYLRLVLVPQLGLRVDAYTRRAHELRVVTTVVPGANGSWSRTTTITTTDEFVVEPPGAG